MISVLLFGASRRGEIAYEKLKESFNIISFIDNDPKKEGMYFCGLKIYSLDSIIDFNDYKIIICSTYDIEIVKQLVDCGMKEFSVFEPKNHSFELKFYNYLNIEDFSIIDNKVCMIIEHTSGSNTLALNMYLAKEARANLQVVEINKLDKTNNYYYDILTSKIILSTHDFRCNNNQINIQLWHGVPLKGLSYMSKYERQDKEVNHNAWSKLDYIVSYSQTYSTLLNACYGVDGKKYKVLGMPRNDMLFDINSRRNVEKILNRKLDNKKVVFYMPTFRKTVFGEKNGELEALINNLPSKQLDSLDKFLGQNNIILIIKLHPEEKQFQCELNNILWLDDKHLTENNLDLYQLIGCTDVLITDYSSVYFDFLLLDKPIIFYSPDFNSYVNDRGLLLEPYDFWAPGKKCTTIDELKQELAITLNGVDLYKEQRKTVCNIIHRYKDDKSCNRVWDFISSILDSKLIEGDKHEG